MTNTKWHYIKLGEFCKIIMGQSPPSLTYNKLGEGLPFFQGVKDFGRMYPTKRVYCTADTRKIAYSGDVLLSVRAPVGEVNVASEKCMIGRGLAALRVKTGNNDDQRFLYYLMLFNKKFWRQLHSGTTFEEITKSDIENLEVFIPQDSSERGKIADILGSLDDKIELNYEMNKTLEAIAQAIFKNWFVDFEPFKDELVYNEELGKEIPKGWEVVELNEILSLEYGEGLPERERIPGNVPVYGSNGIVGWHNKALVKGPGIVVGRKGTAGSVLWSHTDFYPIDTTFYVVPRGKVGSMVYLYFELLYQNLPKLVADSAVPGLNRNIVYLNKAVLPPRNLIKQFDNLAMPLFEMIHINTQESRILEQIRDALLPKLLSGKIRVRVDFEEDFPEEARKFEEVEGGKVKLQESLERWLK